MSLKLVSVWILGAVFMTLGSWIILNLELVVGVTEPAYLIALAVGFLMYLLAGLCWISVSVATRRKLF